MKIIDLVDSRIIISPEALCISPFAELWQLDKSKDKTLATNQIKYIWFYTDFNSPYYIHPELDRHNLILNDVIKDKGFEVTNKIKEGINKYRELHITPSMMMLEAANSAIYKMKAYFENVDLAGSDDIDKVTRAVINFPKMIQAINEAKKQCREEQTSGVRVRGNADVGMFEDK